MRTSVMMSTALLLLSGLTACGMQSVKVSVDSIVGKKEAPTPTKQYLWLSGMREVTKDDLYFREYSRYFQAILRDHGYQEKPANEASLTIYFSYGVSPGRTIQYTTTVPIYDWIGGETIVHTETQKDEKGKTTAKTTSTVTTPVRQRLVGVSVDTSAYTEFTCFISLEAKRYEAGRKPEEMQTLWKTRITSTGPSSDLRALMPVLAAAAAPYVGADTGEATVVKMNPDDPRVTELKQRVRQKPE